MPTTTTTSTLTSTTTTTTMIMLNKKTSLLLLPVVLLLLPHAAYAKPKKEVPLSIYRSIDGSEVPSAATGAILKRLTTAAYPDGVGDMMITEPNPRKISDIVNVADDDVSSTMEATSDMLWIWGQFLDHDIDLTEHDTTDEGSATMIMTPIATETPELCGMDSTSLCFIPFTRSKFADTTTTTTTVRQQVNSVTSFIDASMVYGSTQDRADALREFEGGRLLVQPGTNLLPFNENGLDNAALESNTDPTRLFLAGDVRANEQIGLTAMHTLFVREHNRLVGLLAEEFEGSANKDEELYQMARKIVGAEIQHVTYKEFLPMLLGKNYTPNLKKYKNHNPSVDPAIANEFSTIAFRVGHTMLSGTFAMSMASDNEIDDMSLADAFFNPEIMMNKPDIIDTLIMGFCMQNAQQIDVQIVDEVRNVLFGLPINGFGHDLASLNIQRGRDHGLPPYNALRVGLNLERMETFADITSNVNVQQALSDAYDGDVDRIDAWIGGLAEDHVDGGGLVGELFATIISDQFERLMYGDPFFYLNDNDLKNKRLKKKVMDIKKVKLADIIEANTSMIEFARRANDVFETLFDSSLPDGNDGDDTEVGKKEAKEKGGKKGKGKGKGKGKKRKLLQGDEEDKPQRSGVRGASSSQKSTANSSPLLD